MTKPAWDSIIYDKKRCGDWAVDILVSGVGVGERLEEWTGRDVIKAHEFECVILSAAFVWKMQDIGLPVLTDDDDEGLATTLRGMLQVMYYLGYEAGQAQIQERKA